MKATRDMPFEKKKNKYLTASTHNNKNFVVPKGFKNPPLNSIAEGKKRKQTKKQTKKLK